MRSCHQIFYFTLLVLAVALESCSSSSDDSGSVDETHMPIIFTTPDVAPTRASQTTVSTLTSYGVNCSVYSSSETYTTAAIGSYFYNREIDSGNGDSGSYWPGSNYKVSFFAYAPYGNSNLSVSSSETIGRPTYSLSVPEDISQQVDFISAEVLDHSGAPDSESVKLTFNHNCADLRLAVYNRGDDSITINSISVTGVKYSGTYDGTTWTLSGDANTASSHPFTLTPTTTTVVEANDTVDVTGSEHHLMLIPQTIESGTDFITVNATIAGMTRDYVYTLPSDFTLVQGMSHYLRISLSAEYIDVDTNSEIEDWQRQDGEPT